MWSWKQSHFKTGAARNQMLDFCQREGISHIDQHISIKEGAVVNADAFKALIVQAAARNISVNALRGDKEMFFAENHQRTLNDLKAIVSFNNMLPKGTRLLGVKFDVETYLTAQWKSGGELREKVMLDYLEFLVKSREYLRERVADFELAVDAPFWWDKADYEVTFKGTKKPMVHHILDQVHWAAVMSYRRDSATTIELVSNELEYAKHLGKLRLIAPSMETCDDLGKDAHVGFSELPPEKFRTVLARLRANYVGDPYIRCIMLHHYGSLRPYLEETTE